MSSNEKPCLVSAGQGFSVFYRNKYLYSRYNPYDAPCKSVALARVAPQSLVLAFSPLLGYGVEELLQKTPHDCFVLFIEQDEELYELTLAHTKPLLEAYPNAALVCCKTKADFVRILTHTESAATGESKTQTMPTGTQSAQTNTPLVPTAASPEQTVTSFVPTVPPLSHFRHCVPLSLSLGTRLNEPFYRTITAICDNAINQFWRNRITLVRMGRLYARNIFRNIGRVPFSPPLEKACINRPILVCGSGTSLDDVLPLIKNDDDRLFIIAVDNAFMSLLKHGIIPDRVIAVESQLANEQAFIGTRFSNIHLIADLTSRPHITDITGGEVSFMCTEYEKSSYLSRICKTIYTDEPFVPLGSVGLSAVEVALRLRKTEQVPIFFCGLDFAFVPGKTHCRETPAHRALLNNCTRLSPVLTMERTFTAQSAAVAAKNGERCITDPALLGYGKSFFARYKNVPNLFDVSDFGINTGTARCTVHRMIEFCRSVQDTNEEETTPRAPFASNTAPGTEKSADFGERTGDFDKNTRYKQKRGSFFNESQYKNVLSFYDEEEAALTDIVSRIERGDKSAELVSLIKNHEYLFLHFPDGYKEPTENPGFLNRVRCEALFFLKDIRISRALCIKRFTALH